MFEHVVELERDTKVVRVEAEPADRILKSKQSQIVTGERKPEM